MEKKKAIVFYDGYCNLCNGAVQFLINHDKKKIFHYIPLQSETGQQILKENNITKEDTVIFLYGENIFTRSDAFIKMVQLLPSPWNWLRFIKYLSKNWRNNIYDFIAKNRTRWFGRKKTCTVTNN